jgi:hypothetical protein
MRNSLGRTERYRIPEGLAVLAAFMAIGRNYVNPPIWQVILTFGVIAITQIWIINWQRNRAIREAVKKDAIALASEISSFCFIRSQGFPKPMKVVTRVEVPNLETHWAIISDTTKRRIEGESFTEYESATLALYARTFIPKLETTLDELKSYGLADERLNISYRNPAQSPNIASISSMLEVLTKRLKD